MLLDEDGGWLLVGGKDHIYLLKADSLGVAAATVRRGGGSTLTLTLRSVQTS